MEDVSVVDYHTAGEPFRIVTSVDIPGTSVADRRVTAQSSEAIDAVRRLLVNEPRGHADMYGGFVVPGDDDGADFGVVFWHKDGYSTACGHGTIALATWAVETGLVQAGDVVIDVPSGRVTAHVSSSGVAFRNVPSYVLSRGVQVSTSRGDVLADISYGGAFYASVPASSVGLSVTPSSYADLIAIGREIKWALDAVAVHPTDPRLSGLYGTILYDDLGPAHQRNLAVFADGEADRSPCGSGTSARLALLHDEGRLHTGQVLRHDSIVGTTFLGRVVSETPEGVVTEVHGSAYRTGTATFTVDPRDPLGTGFTLR
ncbi:proline racemase family protein [Kribbella sindirgiensis]|uniref:Proline racemase n=1 Tax=Kribbella sindirgiensis TaxID=1124744 RepID=A0A4R0J5D3_9ACTN|nr:proline racemase family protein [Kribbella sindirgiensis]TCC39358.1 proline racemase [Kribbella sindirgiensis]